MYRIVPKYPAFVLRKSDKGHISHILCNRRFNICGALSSVHPHLKRCRCSSFSNWNTEFAPGGYKEGWPSHLEIGWKETQENKQQRKVKACKKVCYYSSNVYSLHRVFFFFQQNWLRINWLLWWSICVNIDTKKVMTVCEHSNKMCFAATSQSIRPFKYPIIECIY